MLDLRLEVRQPAAMFSNRNGSWALPRKHTSGQRFRLFYLIRRRRLGGSMSRAHQTVSVRDDAIIAFLLFCLEIYQAEQRRKRTLH